MSIDDPRTNVIRITGTRTVTLSWEQSIYTGAVESALKQAMDGFADYDEEEDGYPTLEIAAPFLSDIEMQVLARTCMVGGRVDPGPTWVRMWYCPPSWDELVAFVHAVRLLPHHQLES